MSTPEAITALNKAKIKLMARPDSAFFTTVCFSLRHKWDSKIPTACTNGKEIRFNPEFFLKLDAEERVFLLIHESMHVAYLHMDRLQTRNHHKFNKAADYVINGQLIERGFKMPSMGLHDPQYAGMSTEDVYAKLPDDPEPPPWDDLESPGDAKATAETINDVQDILVRAQIASKMANDKPGSIPGDIEIFLGRLLNPKLPWQRILQKFLQSFAKTDYSFRKPNRRFFPQYHMPSLWGESLCNLAIAVDASGSVSDSDFNRFVSETSGILRMMKPEKISLITFDTEVRAVDEVRNVNELMKVKFTGRGGTMISPVIEWANKNKPQALLVFTDGEFHFYDFPTNIPVVWLIHNNPTFKAPYGQVIHYEMK